MLHAITSTPSASHFQMGSNVMPQFSSSQQIPSYYPSAGMHTALHGSDHQSAFTSVGRREIPGMTGNPSTTAGYHQPINMPTTQVASYSHAPGYGYPSTMEQPTKSWNAYPNSHPIMGGMPGSSNLPIASMPNGLGYPAAPGFQQQSVPQTQPSQVAVGYTFPPPTTSRPHYPPGPAELLNISRPTCGYTTTTTPGDDL